MKNHNRKQIKVYWEDAVIYNRPLSRKDFRLRKKVTTGELFKENDDFLIIKNPQTFNDDRKQKITFVLIPKGMVKNIKIINKI